jgi:hypothetical protein
LLGLVAACVWWCFEWNDVDVTAVLLLPPVVLLHTVCPLPASTPLPQAVCELLSIAGAELEKSAKGKARLEAAFRQLERLAGASRVYAARIRFVVRDVLELRAQHWVARRETFTVRGRRRAEQGEGRLMNTFVQPGGSEHCLPPGKDCKRLGSVLTPPPLLLCRPRSWTTSAARRRRSWASWMCPSRGWRRCPGRCHPWLPSGPRRWSSSQVGGCGARAPGWRRLAVTLLDCRARLIGGVPCSHCSLQEQRRGVGRCAGAWRGRGRRQVLRLPG